MRVRVNSWYVYAPCMIDVCDARTDLVPGDRVQVRNLHGCPPANTMQHAHVFTESGEFAGLVCTSSLRKDENIRHAKTAEGKRIERREANDLMQEQESNYNTMIGASLPCAGC